MGGYYKRKLFSSLPIQGRKFFQFSLITVSQNLFMEVVILTDFLSDGLPRRAVKWIHESENKNRGASLKLQFLFIYIFVNITRLYFIR